MFSVPYLLFYPLNLNLHVKEVINLDEYCFILGNNLDRQVVEEPELPHISPCDLFPSSLTQFTSKVSFLLSPQNHCQEFQEKHALALSIKQNNPHAFIIIDTALRILENT